jgi:threonine aldolase
MRQAGIIAAGALYALENHVSRLKQDHAHAQILADCIRDTQGLTLAQDQVDTNILFFDIDPQLATASELIERLREQGVLMLAETPRRVRALTHLDVSADNVHRAGQLLQSVVGQLAETAGASFP